jgi:hypothetical protein
MPCRQLSQSFERFLDLITYLRKFEATAAINVDLFEACLQFVPSVKPIHGKPAMKLVELNGPALIIVNKDASEMQRSRIAEGIGDYNIEVRT